MPQIGSDEKPLMMRQTIAGKGSRTRKGANVALYKENYDKIFNKSSDQKSDRAVSKTFPTEQDS
jgi:hypothetical protein